MTRIATFKQLRSDDANKTILKGRYGRAWQEVMGSAWDEIQDKMYQARRARWPDYCPADGLFYLGVERGLERVFTVGTMVTEAEANYRRRLKGAWSIWQLAGTQEMHKESFSWCGLNNVQVYRRKEWNSPPEDLVSPYVRAFQRDVWAQFDVLIEQPHPWQPLRWGGWNWGTQGVTWGTTAKTAEIDLLRRLGRTFRSGHDTLTWIVVNTTGGRLWGTWRWGAGAWTPGADQPIRWLCGEPHWRVRGLA